MFFMREELFKMTFFPMLMPLLQGIILLLIVMIGLRILATLLKNGHKRQVKTIEKDIYYRDIPCSGDIHIAYWLLYHFSNIKKDELSNGLFGAYLLSWYKNGYIDILPGTQKNSYTIDLKTGDWNQNYVERNIYSFLKDVAGNNNLLEKNEIRDYCSVDGNNLKLKYLFQQILNDVQKDLEENMYISIVHPKNYIFFRTGTKITLSEALRKEFQNLFGLKNFLSDFSNMEEKRHIEVHIWEEYLIFANILGIADKVKQQFKKYYPDFKMMNNLYDVSFDSTIVAHLDIMYKHLKIRLITNTIVFLLLAIIFITGGKIFTSISKWFPPVAMFPPVAIVLVVGWLFWLLRKYFINKKVKEMDGITHATIRNVELRYEKGYEIHRDIMKKSYSFSYVYVINGVH